MKIAMGKTQYLFVEMESLSQARNVMTAIQKAMMAVMAVRRSQIAITMAKILIPIATTAIVI